MGFGTKMDFTKGKAFDLDKTYRNIIKPAAKAAGLECVRADEIPHSGNINVPMFAQLLEARVVVADVSTYNCNAFYELGVRHALKPHTTIIISEDGMTFPFDVAQIAVRKYHHLGEGIDSEEVDRMRDALSAAMKIIADQEVDDSPVYTFIQDLNPPKVGKAEPAAVGGGAISFAAPAVAGSGAVSFAAPDPPEDVPAPAPANNPTVSVLMQQAEAAMDKDNFIVAKALFGQVHEMMPNEAHVVHRLALATYKSKIPTETEALVEANKLLEGLKPEESTDTETLGLMQAVHKRMWNITKDRADLDKAIWASEKGFYLKNDYYNGINLAFLCNVRASVSEGAEAIADSVIAQRTRRRVIDICQGSLGEDAAKRLGPDGTYWVLATLAEAWVGLGEEAKGAEYMQQALALKRPQWMVDSAQDQLKKLRNLLADSRLKEKG